MSNFRTIFKSLGFSAEKRSCLCIDIGTASIKAALIKTSKEGLELKNYAILESYGHLERVNDAIQTSNLKILDIETVELLKKLLKEMEPGVTNVAASLPSFSAFSSLLEMPVMSSEETTQAMQFQAKSFVPMPLTEVTIDWIPVGEYEDEKGVKKQQIFLVAVTNEQIHKYQNIFQETGLDLKTLEVETLSLARLLTTGDPTSTLIVDIGARSTAIAVAERGVLKFSAQTDFAGGSLTQALARGMGISVRRAEDLKRQKGLIGTGGDYQISTLMLPYTDVILNEVRRVKEEYERTYGTKISRVLLSGGGANLLGIEKYVSDEFGLPAVKVDPFSMVKYPPEISPLMKTLGVQLAVTLGLGMGQFTKNK